MFAMAPCERLVWGVLSDSPNERLQNLVAFASVPRTGFSKHYCAYFWVIDKCALPHFPFAL